MLSVPPMPESAVRTPKQKRSRDSQQRVLNTAERLLAEEGFENFTIQQVSQSAGVSIGAIYARFGSKENLLRAVHRAAMEGMRATSHHTLDDDGEWTRLAPRELVREAVRRVALPFRTHDGLLRAFMHAGAIDDEVAALGSQNSIDLANRFESLLLTRISRKIRHRDAEVAIDIAFRMAYSTFARRVMYGPTFESDRLIGWDDLTDEVGAAAAAYLLDSRA